MHRRALNMMFEHVEPVVDEPGLTPRERLWKMSYNHAALMMRELDFMHVVLLAREIRMAREGRTSDEDIASVISDRQRYEELSQNVIADGVGSGDFKKVDTATAMRAVLGSLNWIAIWYQPKAHADAIDRIQQLR